MINLSQRDLREQFSNEKKTSKKRSRSELGAEIDSLHVVGYKIFKAAIEVPKEIVDESIKKSTKAPAIFNQNEKKRRNDNKRRQYSLSANKSSKKMKEFLNSTNDFILENVSSVLKPATWVVIHSKQGCQSQAAHSDYVPDLSLASVPDHQMPLSALLALMPGTKLNVWPNSSKLSILNENLLEKVKPISCEQIDLEAGDLLVFRGDFVHAGSSYENDNYRLHTFLDSGSVKRSPNKTWIVHEHANEAFKKIIVPLDGI